MLKYFFKKIFGNFQSKAEFKKYAFLGFIFGTLIATYWVMRPLKDGIFMSIVGQDYQPYAKMLSLFVVLVLIAIYSKLIDVLPRSSVFYILTGFYALGAFLFYFALKNPAIGIPNTVESPYRIIGWLWYLFVESSATLLVPLFWAFLADVSTARSAARGFPIVALCAQLGHTVGPLFFTAQRLGFAGSAGSAPVVGIVGFMFLFIGALIWAFMKVTPRSEFHEQEDEESAPQGEKLGLLEGLKLLLKQKYLLGIFLCGLAFEAVSTIIDFYFKVQIKTAFPLEIDRSSYLATFAVITGLVSVVCLLFGISNIQRKFGMRISLSAMPVIMMCGVFCWVFLPGFGYEGLKVAFVVLTVFKSMNYAINQPSIKQLYIPTSKDARYKAQAWIEVFGSRGSKALGSGVNAIKLPLQGACGQAAGAIMFLLVASAVSFGLLSLWIFVAVYVAGRYNKAVAKNRVIC